jgi:hypothetical protein
MGALGRGELEYGVDGGAAVGLGVVCTPRKALSSTVWDGVAIEMPRIREKEVLRESLFTSDEWKLSLASLFARKDRLPWHCTTPILVQKARDALISTWTTIAIGPCSAD